MQTENITKGKTSGHRILTKGRIAWCAVIEDWTISSAAYVHPSRNSQCFSMGWGTHKSSPSHGGISTLSNTWFLGPTRVSPKWNLDQFSCFCRAHTCL